MYYQLINFGNNTLQLHHNRTLLWREENILVVSDLHLEKGSSYQLSGQFIPPYDTKETLERLRKIIDMFKPNLLILLGDVFHDKYSLKRMNDNDKKLFDDILSKIKTIFVEGNHDINTLNLNRLTYRFYKKKNLFFKHIYSKEKKLEITGHYHPNVTIKNKGIKLRCPCFIVSKNKIILPSFGKYTGGLDLNEKAFSNFKYEETFIFVITNKNITKLKWN